MVLLTIIAVGLLSLSTIALRGTGHEAAMATARANARMALMLAIGELQKQAGPDQRVTATADMAGTATGDSLAAGTPPANNTSVNSVAKGLTTVQPGTRFWTGVWYQTAAPTQIYTRTPSPVLRGWLVSGGTGPAGSATRPNPASSEATVGSAGDVSDTTKAVVLVGKNSAGTTDSGRYVGVPLVEIGNPDKQAKQPAGRQGWWVGDEGVKAKFNQVPADGSSTDLTYQTMGDRRAGWEAVDGFNSYPIPGSGQANDVAKVITAPEGRLLNPAFGDKGSSGESPMQRNFHALTTDSTGLLVDNFNGGLRVDMTPYIRGGFPDELKAATIVPKTIASKMRAPTWNRIKEFGDMFSTLDNGRLIVKPAANDLGVAIAPTISELRFLFGVRAVPVDGSTTNFKLNTCVKVAVTLANPYPYPLKWNTPLDMEVTNSQPSGTQGVDGGYQPASIFDAAQGATGRPAFVPSTPSQPAALNNAIFRIAADEIPAGEAKAFTIGGPVYRPPGNASRVTVDMKPFGSAQPTNFDNCIEQGHDAQNNLTSSLAMDMRESWTTTQITIDLRSGSSANSLLRRIERFELDNAYYATTKRPIDATKAKEMKRPFGIHYYRFQFSQPGNDYRSMLPNPVGVDPLGLRSSTLRSFADFNAQGKRFHKAITSYNPTPYFMQSVDNLGDLPYNAPGGETGSAFTRDMAITPIAWGRSNSDTKKVILFSPQEKFVSLAQLQHADLTGDDTFGSVGHQPGNAVGNSYATPFVKRSQVIQSRNNYTVNGQNSSGGFQTVAMNYYDIAYLLNTSLWDTYYFSAMDSSGSSVPESPAVVKINASDDSNELRDAKLAAAHLAIDGAFNVNSTRKEAWKALFAGSKHLKHKADAAASSDAIYPRSLEQKSAAAVPPTGEMEDSWAGFRRLTDAQLDALAEEMVRQVRLRGPFLSLSQFVNRAIVDVSRDKVLGRSGALQTALDECGININNAGTKNAFHDVTVTEDRLNIQYNGSAPRGDLDGTRAMSYTEANPSEPVWATTSKDLNAGAMASILADRPMLTNPRFRTEQGYRSTGIPGWVTQADVLQVIGPALSARSDTFRIRAYGEATDPVTGEATARAWCEAVVQRVPEYVDGKDVTAEVTTNLKSPVNKMFGRRFVAVSFKWLSKDEI